MDARVAMQRSALMAEALVAVLVAVTAVIVAFVPQCEGISAFPGSPGGRFCNTFLSRGGPILIGIATLAVSIAVIDVIAALRPHGRAAVAVLVIQLPVAIAAGIGEVIWISHRAQTGFLVATFVLLVTAVIVIASPRWSRS